MTARFIVGDVFDVLASMKDESVDLVMTSPPFLALRSYLPADHPDKAKEIGSEATPADFLDTLLDLTEEWGRVLAPHGSICVELGDTYSGSGGAGGDYTDTGLRAGQEKFAGSAIQHRRHAQRNRAVGVGWPLDKSLTLIPTLYAASLAYGRNLLNPDHTFQPWRVRNLVAWVRPNPPVGALGDKVRPATSYLTWATRSRTRWFDLDAVRTAHARDYSDETPGGDREFDRNGTISHERTTVANPAGAPPLDWWKISPGGYQGAHYATFPEELCRIPIEASCARRVCLTCGQPSRRELSAATSVTSQRDTTGWSTCGCPDTDGIRLDGYHTGSGWRPGHVLDPFGGSGTTAVVATGRGRDCTLIDIDSRNAELARERLGMFLEVDEPTAEGAA